MFKVAGLVAILTILSKILGLGRDLVIAHYFGTSMEADAFNLAYLLTGNFFIILGGIGGPFYSSIVAVLPKLQTQNFNLKPFINEILKKLTLVSIGAALVLYFTKSYIVQIFIDKGLKAEYFEQTLLNIDILLPLIILAAPIGVLFATLNCLKKYFAPSLAPAAVNVVLIATVLLMGDGFNGLSLAIGTSIGGIVSYLMQIPFNLQKDLSNLIDIGKEKLMSVKKEFYILLIPALLSTSSTQIMVFIDSYFCKYLQEGSWTSITIANRLVQMPLGVILTAFLVPVFPKISEMVEQKRFKRIKEVLTKALGILLLISIPGIIIGTLYPREIISLIFERGAFNAESTALVAEVFFYLCLSIIPYIFRDSFTRTLYCFGDSRSPLYVMLTAIVLKFILNSFLVPQYGIAGIAISTVAASAFNATCLFFILSRKFKDS
jgi:putative peptidoglycan lipid II flippase